MVSMLDRLHFTASIRLESDAHIGTGERIKRSEFLGLPPPNDTTAADPEVALAARGHNKTLIIPATALKSALRRAIEVSDKARAERLFGVVKDTNQGQIGNLWLETATCTAVPTDCSDLPHWNKGKGHPNSHVASHVAIERATRTAEDKKLYMIERVPSGTKFSLSGDVFGLNAIDDLKVVADILARGITVGADERHGAGRLILDGDITYDEHGFDSSMCNATANLQATLSPTGANSAPSAPSVLPWSASLACQGPYVSLDTTKAVGNKRGAARRSTQRPTLAPASLLGALRSRCAWLSHSVAGIDNKSRGDAPFRPAIKRNKIAALTSTERLFGVNGWRGLLRIAQMEISGTPGARPYTSVALDRFTQGPLDEALFETEYFHDCTLTLSLAAERRLAAPTSDDQKLFDTLCKDIEANGLLLGHGTNKGFGWFLPMLTTQAQASSPTEPDKQKKSATQNTAQSLAKRGAKSVRRL